ncbi:MAG: tetratricopeptide repeat protein [Saprospiraceae bacterium]|jgi:tetratricopeptide (TPR) repeat protein
MFVIHIYLRFALMGVLTIGGIVLSATLGFWYGFPFWLIGLVLVIGYVMLGTVQSAAELMQKMDLDGAEKRLSLTLSPKLLYTANRAYYFITKGTIALHRKRTDEAEEWLHKAENLKLPTEDEAAMVQLQLANIQATRNKWQAAQIHFRKAKKFKVTNGEIKKQMKEFEKVLSNRGQVKVMQQSGMSGASAASRKRRRPRMR